MKLLTIPLLFLITALPICADELQTLRDAYEREKERLVEPLDEKLKQQLEALKLSLVKDGKLEDAAKVDAVLKERFPQPEPSPKEPYKFGPSVWEYSSNRIQFREDGRFSHSRWRQRGTWTAEGNRVTVIKPNGRKIIFDAWNSGEGGTWREPNAIPKTFFPVRK